MPAESMLIGIAVGMSSALISRLIYDGIKGNGNGHASKSDMEGLMGKQFGVCSGMFSDIKKSIESLERKIEDRIGGIYDKIDSLPLQNHGERIARLEARTSKNFSRT